MIEFIDSLNVFHFASLEEVVDTSIILFNIFSMLDIADFIIQQSTSNFLDNDVKSVIEQVSLDLKKDEPVVDVHKDNDVRSVIEQVSLDLKEDESVVDVDKDNDVKSVIEQVSLDLKKDESVVDVHKDNDVKSVIELEDAITFTS